MNRKELMILALLFSIFLLLATGVSAGQFVDVPYNHNDGADMYLDPLQSEGFIEGYPDNTFRGNRGFTRYECAAIIARIYERMISEVLSVDPGLQKIMMSAPFDTGPVYFQDVPYDHWAVGYVAVMDNSGIMVGDENGFFNGDKILTRAEFGVIVNRLVTKFNFAIFAEEESIDGSDSESLIFADLTSDHWAYESFQSLCRKGLFQANPDDKFRGGRTITRYEIAMVLGRIWGHFRAELDRYSEQYQAKMD